ncbi:hypothetical protein [Streptomyces sp. NPDC093149]|uniref:hypothetical protein n=1 Tax=Streptomyces sp. NPDC093149 TaxID=3366031 RepID=UPI0038184807
MNTTAVFLTRLITREEEQYRTEIQRVADLAALLAAAPPDAARAPTGDLTRLSQYVTDSLSRAAKLAALREAHQLLEADTTTPAQ